MTILFSDVSFGPVAIFIWGPPLLVFLAVAALCALAVFLIVRAAGKNNRGKTGVNRSGKTGVNRSDKTGDAETTAKTESEGDTRDDGKRV